MMSTTQQEATIEAVPDLPVITITREFAATPEQLVRAHTDPALFARWVGPKDCEVEVLEWDARTGGHWRYTATNCDGGAEGFYGSFHFVGPDRLVQTFTWEGAPEGVSLETLRFEDAGNGRTRLVGTSVVESLEIRDMILRSGMDVGVSEGYAKLDDLLDADEV